MKRSLAVVGILCVFLMLIWGCALLRGTAEYKEIRFGPWTYSVPQNVPVFVKWQGQFHPMPLTPNFGLLVWEGPNPQDGEEWVMAMIAVEGAGSDETIKGFIVGIQHTKSIKDMVSGKGGTETYIDKQYIETGRPSFVLTKANDIPKLDNFVELKKKEFPAKGVRWLI